MKRDVLIRVDGSPKIGLGHIIRCTSLAIMLKKKYAITFVCKEIPFDLNKYILKLGFDCIIIRKEEEFFDLLNNEKIVVIDGYSFDYEYQTQIKSFGIKLVCIDDLHENCFNCDLIINYTPGINASEYNALPYTIFALGIDYILLRPLFLKQAKKHRKVNKRETIFICFGGADPVNLTKIALELTLKLLQVKKIFIVTGHANQNKSNIERITKSNNRIVYKHALNEEQILKLMIESDIAIIPASSILFEAIAVGCIPITGKYTDNQKFVYEYFKKSKTIVDAGAFSYDELSLALNNISIEQNRERLIDGLSPVRILKQFNILEKEFSIYLRRANNTDFTVTFAWANNEIIRRFAFNQQRIGIEEHSTWFINKINNPSCFYYIARHNNNPIGSIRFDILDREALISYLIDPLYHGKSFGKVILKKGIEVFLKDSSEQIVNVIVGKVFKENIQSIKAFESLGFDKIDNNDYYKYEKWLTINQ